jgi:Transcriptional regulatory protein, C terminal
MTTTAEWLQQDTGPASARARRTPPRTVEIGAFRMDRGARTVHVAGREVALTTREFDLLSLLLSRAGCVQSRRFLIRRLWGSAFDGDDNTLYVHIHRLRAKLGRSDLLSFRIRTVVRHGYRVDVLDGPPGGGAGTEATVRRRPVPGPATDPRQAETSGRTSGARSIASGGASLRGAEARVDQPGGSSRLSPGW